jgi:lipoprotein-releasing system permease protein
VARVPFTLFLALRYLKPVRVSVSLITAISVLGVVFGVLMLVVVISVMTGFDRELQRKVLGFDAHIFITNDQLLRNWRALDEQVQKVPGIQATAPFAQGPVIVEFNGRVLTPKIRGIDVSREVKLIDLPSIMQAGTHEMQSDQCIIGTGLADQLDLILGDKITVYAPRNISQVLDLIERIRKDPKDSGALDELKEVVLPVELAVTGIFEVAVTPTTASTSSLPCTWRKSCTVSAMTSTASAPAASIRTPWIRFFIHWRAFSRPVRKPTPGST